MVTMLPMASTTRAPISVIIPAYRAEAHLAGAIRSVTAQACLPAEIIVVDDASPDRSGEIAAELGARVIRLPQNAGVAAARNAGAAVAVQPWIAFLDADDVWLDGKLEAQWQAICRWPDAGFCFTDYDAVYANGRVLPRETAADPGYARMRAAERAGDAAIFSSDAMVRGLIRSMFVRQSSVVVNRALHLACGGYDARWRLGEDYDYFLRLSSIAPAIAIERSLVAYQRRAGSLSADPLAEIASVDALWSAILREPGEYSPVTVTMIRKRHAAMMRRGSVLALRMGRFDESADFARRAHAIDRSLRAPMLLAIVRLLDTPTGNAVFRAARNAWRRRPGRAPSTALS